MTETYSATQFGAKFTNDGEVVWFTSLGGLRAACNPGCQVSQYRRPLAVYVRDLVTVVEVRDEGELAPEWIDRLASPYEGQEPTND